MEMIDLHTEQIFRLGKRQANVLREVVSGIPLINLEGASPLSRHEATRELAAFEYADTFAHSGGTNTDRPVVIDGMVGTSARKTGYMTGLAKGDLHSLLQASTETCSSRQIPLVLRIVYGATEQAPLRALSYPLPALQAIGRIRRQSNIEPYVQIVFADTLSGELNSLDEQQVHRESEIVTQGIQRLSEQLGVGEHVGFYDDSEVGFDAVDEAARVFGAVAPDSFVALLVGKGSDNDYGTTCRYAAAHYVLHDDPDTRLTHLSGAELPSPYNIVDVGGTQEKYFKAARALLAKAAGRDMQSAQLYTRHHVPPYYMARGGDIGLSDFLDGQAMPGEIATTARRDMEYMNNVVDVLQLREEASHV